MDVILCAPFPSHLHTTLWPACSAEPTNKFGESCKCLRPPHMKNQGSVEIATSKSEAFETKVLDRPHPVLFCVPETTQTQTAWVAKTYGIVLCFSCM